MVSRQKISPIRKNRTKTSQTSKKTRVLAAREPVVVDSLDTLTDEEASLSDSGDVQCFDELIEAGLSDKLSKKPKKDLSSEATELPATLPALSGARAVSTIDPLKQYLREISKYPLLSSEEEMKWAKKLRDSGDIEAARALVQANLRLVVKIAFEYRSVYANVMDLIQEGNMGLMKAVSKFDLSKGARFGYYSSWWIRSYILKYLLDNFRLVRVGTTQAQKKLFFHLMQERERLESQGILPSPKLIADRLNVREKDVLEMQGRLGPSTGDVSLEAERTSESGQTSSLKGKLIDPGVSPEDLAIDAQGVAVLKAILPKFKKTLNGKELSILEERMLAEEPKTLQEVADRYQLTRERARQIESKVLTKLREFIKNPTPEGV